VIVTSGSGAEGVFTTGMKRRPKLTFAIAARSSADGAKRPIVDPRSDWMNVVDNPMLQHIGLSRKVNLWGAPWTSKTFSRRLVTCSA
jgi:hypothetical protein